MSLCNLSCSGSSNTYNWFTRVSPKPPPLKLNVFNTAGSVCAALCSRITCPIVSLKMRERKSLGIHLRKENNNLISLWTFNVQSWFSSMHTGTIKQLHISLHQRVSLFRGLCCDLTVVCSSSLGGFDKRWHSSTILREFTASKSVWQEQKKVCKIWNIRKYCVWRSWGILTHLWRPSSVNIFTFLFLLSLMHTRCRNTAFFASITDI